MALEPIRDSSLDSGMAGAFPGTCDGSHEYPDFDLGFVQMMTLPYFVPGVRLERR
jgi:hypothetical protein